MHITVFISYVRSSLVDETDEMVQSNARVVWLLRPGALLHNKETEMTSALLPTSDSSGRSSAKSSFTLTATSTWASRRPGGIYPRSDSAVLKALVFGSYVKR